MEKKKLEKEIESRLTAKDGVLIINNATVMDRYVIGLAFDESRCGANIKKETEFNMCSLAYLRNINLTERIRILLLNGLDNVICDTSVYIELMENREEYDEEDQIDLNDYIDLEEMKKLNDYANTLYDVITKTQVE